MKASARKLVPWAVLTLAVGLAGGGMVLLGSRLSRISEDHLRLSEENRQLREALDKAQAEREGLQRAPWDRAPSPTPPAEDAMPKPKVEPRTVPSNTLLLDGATVTPSNGALVARMQFRPAATNALDVVALVVRLPRAAEGRILALQPADDATYSNAVHRVSEDGLFAVYQAHPTRVEPLAFDLTVSGPARATVRGTNGLEPFEIDIRPTGASIDKI